MNYEVRVSVNGGAGSTAASLIRILWNQSAHFFCRHSLSVLLATPDGATPGQSSGILVADGPWSPTVFAGRCVAGQQRDRLSQV